MTESLPSERLHPASWVFYAVRALREIGLPAVIVIILRRDDEIGSLVVAAATALFVIVYGIAKSRTFRFEVMADEIVIREGLLVRELRHVPFTRIQSVSERRGLLHRLLDVTELVLESGSGGKPEAVMQVLHPAAAARISEALRQRRAALDTPAETVASTTEEPPRVLLKLPTAELVRLGVISNRGLVVVAVVVGAISQNAELLRLVPGIDRLPTLLGAGVTDAAGTSLAQLVVGALMLLLAALVVIRVLSVTHAIFTQHDFTLERNADRLRIRRGLLTRFDLSGRVSGIQRLILEQTLLHRVFRRCRLNVDMASQSVQSIEVAPQLNQLAPIATLPQAQALLRECVPALDLDSLEWHSLHRSAAQRRWQRALLWQGPLAIAIVMVVPALPIVSNGMTLALLLVAGMLAGGRWHAWRWAKTARYAADRGVVLWRSGVWTHRAVLLFEDRAQATILCRSPRDRREATVSFCVDAQGMILSRALHIPFVAESDARALNQRFRTGNPRRF